MSTLRDETLSDLLKALWSARLYLLVGSVGGFVMAAVIVLFAVPHMRAVMVVAPTTEAIALQTSGLSQNLQSPNETLPFLRYLKILSGPSVTAEVIKNNPEVQKALSKSKRFTFQDDRPLQNSNEISSYLTKNIVIKPVGDTPLRTIELEHPNPIMARDLLMQLHITADTVLRKEILERTKSRLAYLKEMLSQTANLEHRAALTDLLIEQERLGMMIRMDKYFAANLVEQPFIHPKPVWPRKSYIFPLCVMVGMMMGWVIFGVVRSYEGSDNRPSSS